MSQTFAKPSQVRVFFPKLNLSSIALAHQDKMHRAQDIVHQLQMLKGILTASAMEAKGPVEHQRTWRNIGMGDERVPVHVWTCRVFIRVEGEPRNHLLYSLASFDLKACIQTLFGRAHTGAAQPSSNACLAPVPVLILAPLLVSVRCCVPPSWVPPTSKAPVLAA